jgi:hypothetical protein
MALNWVIFGTTVVVFPKNVLVTLRLTLFVNELLMNGLQTNCLLMKCLFSGN